MITPSVFGQSLAALIASLDPSSQAAVRPYASEACARIGASMPAAGVPALAAAVASPGIPSGPDMGQGLANRCWIPSLNIPGCPVKCDPCFYAGMELDLQLTAWPLIEDQMYDTQTNLDVVTEGAFPLTPGQTIVLAQEARRTRTYIPNCVEIATTWTNNTPQVGHLTYQWEVAPKFGSGGAVEFSNPQKGPQYEVAGCCKKVPFPEYKGCDNLPIGLLASLRLRVTLAAAATESVEAIMVTVYHKRKAKKCCGDNKCSDGACHCD